MLFKPVVELVLREAFLSQDPLDIITSGKAADVPLLTGLTTDEGDMRTASSSKELLEVPNLLLFLF